MAEERGGRISLQSDPFQIPQESPNDAFVRTSSSRVFPLVLMRVSRGSSPGGAAVEVRVDEKTYDFLKTRIHTDSLMLYLDASNGFVGQLGYDMIATFQVMAGLGMLPDIEDWITESRQSMSNLLSGRVDHAAQHDKALKQASDILDALGILDEVQQLDLLHSTASEVLRDKKMDVGTMIYRMAMAIYHSGMTGKSVVSIMDDPSSAYFKMVGSAAYKSMRSEFSPVMNLPLGARIHATKVLITFVIASYVYHKAIGGNQK